MFNNDVIYLCTHMMVNYLPKNAWANKCLCCCGKQTTVLIVSAVACPCRGRTKKLYCVLVHDCKPKKNMPAAVVTEKSAPHVHTNS